MKKRAWTSHEFSSSMPVLEKPEVVNIDNLISDLEKKYKKNEISENILYSEMNKIYIKYIHSAGSIYAHKMADINKVKLHYAHLIIDGERDKIDRRKKVLQHIIRQGY